MKTYRLAVIGSRETDHETMQEMYDKILRGLNILLKKDIPFEFTSGGCWKGPDQLQFQFAQQWRSIVDGETGQPCPITRDKFICYLPDDKKLWLKTKHPNVDFRVIEQTEIYNNIVRSLHPAPDYLDDVSMKLHGRNLNIIMGDDLLTPVDAVYYSAPLDKRGNPKGGTAMGVAYAKSVNVPTYHHARDGDDWLASLRLL